ncbi:MAG TPA: hypothetical protein VNT51_01535, partial [Miltoncostaeaceae bacterium]|nr:hypothetical protein [Miltoncostaeaceae bacterium]
MAGLVLARGLVKWGQPPVVIERMPQGTVIEGPIMLPFQAYPALDDLEVLGSIAAEAIPIPPERDGRPIAMSVPRETVLGILRAGLRNPTNALSETRVWAGKPAIVRTGEAVPSAPTTRSAGTSSSAPSAVRTRTPVTRPPSRSRSTTAVDQRMVSPARRMPSTVSRGTDIAIGRPSRSGGIGM